MPKVKAKGSEYGKGLVSRHQIIDKIMTLTTPIWDSRAKKLKPRMTLAQACAEVDIGTVTYHNWLKQDAALAQMVEDVKNSHRQMMEDMAEGIIQEGLSGGVKLRPSERIGFAFRYLEKTSPYFNPTQKVELEARTDVTDMTEEEILNRIKELSSELDTQVFIPNEIKQDDCTITNTIEECEGDETPSVEAGEVEMNGGGDINKGTEES